MRHITFDESTVLNEFARIAGETGMIKTAAAPDAEQAKKLKDDVLKQLQSIDANLREEPAKKALIDHIQNLIPISVADLTKAITALFGDPQAPKGSYARMFPKAFAAVTNTIKPYQDTAAKARQDSAMAVATPPAKADDGIETQASVKQADSKLYDVSGETGEDLVDSAHPGNAKVSDDVVETIIEQQECDLEVVNKVPKGTYASLVELYNKLHKEGHKEVLGDLLDVIKAIATPEDIATHTLMALANELDSRGLTKQADAVDGMLTKFADDAAAKILQDSLIREIKGLEGDKFEKQQAEGFAYKVKKMDTSSVTSLMQNINDLLGDPDNPGGSYARGVPGLWDLVSRYNNSYSETMKLEQSQQQAKQQPAAQQQPAQPAVNQDAGKQNDPNAWKKDPDSIKAFQINYNDEYEAVFGKGKRPLREDSTYGKNTDAAAKLVARVGEKGLNGYFKRLKKQRAEQAAKQQQQQQAPGKETATPPAPPEAPPPPTSMAPSWDDTYKMYRETFIRTHGPRLLSKNMDDVLKDEAQKLYNVQEQRRTSGQPAYSVDAMRNYISKYIQSIDKNDLLQART